MSDYYDEIVPNFFGLVIPTHRSSTTTGAVLYPYFPYEPLIAIISIMFFRYTVYMQFSNNQKKTTNHGRKDTGGTITTTTIETESILLRICYSIVLGVLMYMKYYYNTNTSSSTNRITYQFITTIEIFTYIFSYVLYNNNNYTTLLLYPKQQQQEQQPTLMITLVLQRIMYIAIGGIVSVISSHILFVLFCNSNVQQFLIQYCIPNIIRQSILYLFPITEIYNAYTIMYELSINKILLQQMIQYLFFVTFHIQVGMGFLGIAFLRSEQSRRNQLIRLDVHIDDNSSTNDDIVTNNSNNNNNNNTNHMNGTNTTTSSNNHVNGHSTKADDERMINPKEKQMLERSKAFQRGATSFILLSALPYMAQIIVYGSINQYAYACIQDELHRTIRFEQVFQQDNHLTLMVNDSPTSPEAYASSMNTVVSTAYEIFNRKLFSLPKVLLLPGVMSRQPLLVAQVFPFIFLSDWLKASAVSYMTTKIESLQKEINEINSIRSKVESFDIKNAELLQRSGKDATQFTQKRWEKLTIRVQSRQIISDLLGRGKGFFAFMQRNFIFTVLIDCALANLIAIGKILPAEIFVYSRAIEDAVDMLLMRSRGEAELARMMTEIEKLDRLRIIWDNSQKQNLLRCLLDDHQTLSPSTSPTNKKIILRNLHYSRGTATARADHIELGSGVYALTGANGSGKSTLFRILMSCDTNEKSIELPSSINLLTPAEPLTEEDDLRRATECVVGLDDDEIAIDESCETDASKGRELHPRSSITMPSKHVVEISQNFYWPLYSKPIDWIFQRHSYSRGNDQEQLKQIRKVAEELHSLQFFQAGKDQTIEEGTSNNVTIAIDGTIDSPSGGVVESSSDESTIQRIMLELQQEKEDWFGDLSGGQKSKVELVRTVFLREKCPDVLLIDETMAPLDPASKELVMSKLKKFCSESIMIVIYHTDVGQGKEIEGKMVDCVRSNDFFSKNIHLEHGIVHLRETC